jgi:hypothetical protein
MDKGQDTKPYLIAAKSGWIAFGSALVATAIGKQIGHRAIVDVIVLICVLTGAISGIVALIQMPKSEMKKNLGLVLISLLLNSLIIFIWITNAWRAFSQAKHGG